MAGLRYHGFRATIIEAPGSSFKLKLECPPLVAEPTINFTDFVDNKILTNPPWEAHLGAACLNTSCPVGAKGLLFIERAYAMTLDLGDPKLPIGLGLSEDPGDPPAEDPPLADPGKPHKPPPSTGPTHKSIQRLRISVAHPDDFLGEVLNSIDGEARVVGGISRDKEQSTVCSVVDRRRKRGHRVAVDLIAHSRNGILELGSWKVHAGDPTCYELYDEWKERSPNEIRLLGCSTAREPEGRAAMQHLKNVFRQAHGDFRVYGSKTALLAGDFGPAGFLRPDLLIELEELLAALPGTNDIVKSWSGRFTEVPGGLDVLKEETKEEAMSASIGPLLEPHGGGDHAVGRAALEKLINSLDSVLFKAPGLLEIPEAEHLYPAGAYHGIAKYHRVSSFLGGAFVRLYTAQHPRGVVMRRTDTSR
jgi:hypothetical protein